MLMLHVAAVNVVAAGNAAAAAAADDVSVC